MDLIASASIVQYNELNMVLFWMGVQLSEIITPSNTSSLKR